MHCADRRGSNCDARLGREIQPSTPCDLEPHQVDERRACTTFAEVDPEPPQVLLGQILAPTVQVLGDVAHEVRELEGETEIACRAERSRRGSVGSRIGSIISPITAADPSM